MVHFLAHLKNKIRRTSPAVKSMCLAVWKTMFFCNRARILILESSALHCGAVNNYNHRKAAKTEDLHSVLTCSLIFQLFSFCVVIAVCDFFFLSL